MCRFLFALKDNHNRDRLVDEDRLEKKEKSNDTG
jgi:hypothetical protein